MFRSPSSQKSIKGEVPEFEKNNNKKVGNGTYAFTNFKNFDSQMYKYNTSKNDPLFFLILFRCPGVSKDKKCWFWGLVTGSETKKSQNFEFWASQIMKSGFYCTNLQQINSRKILKVVFKHMFTINGQQNAIIIPIIVPMIFL